MPPKKRAAKRAPTKPAKKAKQARGSNSKLSPVKKSAAAAAANESLSGEPSLAEPALVEPPDTMDDRYEGSDGSYDDEEEDPTPRRTAREPAACDEEDRRKRQMEDVCEVVEYLGVTAGAAALLLRHCHWKKETLFERYMDDADKVCIEAGVLPPSQAGADASAMKRAVSGFTCSVCRDDDCPSASSLACGHMYCDGCWGAYVSTKVESGETRITCMTPHCSLAVTGDVVDELTTPATAAKYRAFVLNSVVEDGGSGLVWCPIAACGQAVTRPAALLEATGAAAGGAGPAGEAGPARPAPPNPAMAVVTCGNGHTFCSACKHEAHAPADCDMVKTWLQKCADDSETYNWLNANTQDCPNCKSTIEKNGGCNHMTCKKCKGEFCWVCMSTWASHTDYYSCNKFDPTKMTAAATGKANSRLALERYLFHYHRFQNHDNSRKLDAKTRADAERKLVEAAGRQVPGAGKVISWGDAGFIVDGTSAALACRGVLKWTYVLAHALGDESNEKALFCLLQQDLEVKTERLSGLLEADVAILSKPEVRADVLNLTSVALASMRKLIEGTAGVGRDAPLPIPPVAVANLAKK